jgi:ATP-dependent DNA helicase RecQ
MESTKTLLNDVFGFNNFRPGQGEIIDAVTSGENVLAIMPTGGGKSLCFQLPALLNDGLTVVISPLIALMRDQVRGLQAAGVAAGAITSGNTQEETDTVFSQIGSGDLKLLYVAPERLNSSRIQNILRKSNVNSIAVDEAHCVSQWGHDFRPDYLNIGKLRRSLGVPLSAFTATADNDTQQEIIERLFDGVTPKTFLRGFDRPNIFLASYLKINLGARLWILCNSARVNRVLFTVVPGPKRKRYLKHSKMLDTFHVIIMVAWLRMIEELLKAALLLKKV